MDLAGSAIGSLLGPKQPKPQKKYYDRPAQDILYGLGLTSLANWGSPLPEAYLSTQSKRGSEFTNLFGGHQGMPGGSQGNEFNMANRPDTSDTKSYSDWVNGMYGRSPSGGSQTALTSAPQAMQMNVSDNPVVKVLDFMKKPKVRFGYGGGNMGQYTGGYGGPIS